MNKGTKLRTILAIATAINTANVMSAFAEFDNTILDAVYKVLSLIALIIVLSANTYYNNDYTPEGETGTLTTRQMKELKNYEWIPAEEPEDAEVSENDD